MSSTTSAVAVAVRARTGGRPSSSIDRAQGQVVGPEVVAPLADAVGLVDHEQVDRDLAQERAELGVGEPLGGRVDEVLVAARDRSPRPPARSAAESVLLIATTSMPLCRAASRPGPSSARSAG